MPPAAFLPNHCLYQRWRQIETGGKFSHLYAIYIWHAGCMARRGLHGGFSRLGVGIKFEGLDTDLHPAPFYEGAFGKFTDGITRLGYNVPPVVIQRVFEALDSEKSGELK